MQRIYLQNPDVNSSRFIRLPNLDDRYDNEFSYVGRMIELSGELMTFSVGGPLFFKNNTIVECLNQWSEHNLTNIDYSSVVEIYGNYPKVYGSPLFRRHYENATSPGGLRSLEKMIGDIGNYSIGILTHFKMHINMIMLPLN